MTVLTVGSGEQYATIASAVAASQSGDTIDVQAGTYTNDFTSIDHNLTLLAVGGMVTMAATVPAPDGKAILTEGGSGLNVSIDGFAFTGAEVPDGNGAGIRYQGGDLTISNSHFYGNQDGILGAADPNGNISISDSEFDYNGVGGTGYTHNIYIGDINSFTLTDSFIHDANLGHEIKSRAENNTITNNRIFDNNSTASYDIDLPNGGNAVITGNIIQKGVNSQNSTMIAYGEEGNLYAGTSLSVSDDTFVNDLGRGPALWNATTSTVASFTNNAVYGFGATPLVNGAATQNGTVVLNSQPALDQSAPYSVAPTPLPSIGITIAPVTSALASVQGAGRLNGGRALAALNEMQGNPGDTYTYSLGGSDAASFSVATAANVGTLSSGAFGVAGATNGKLYSLTITATDLTSGVSSPAAPVDVIVGGSGMDTVPVATLSGALGTATPTFIYGLAGSDRIDATGMSGKLWFDGGAGADKMTGGSGVNDYLYGSASDSTSSAMDIITNFHAAVDLIDLTGLATALGYVGQIPATKSKIGLAAHSVGWQTSSGNTFIYVNTSGKSEALSGTNMKIELQGAISLSSSNIAHL